MNEDIKGLKEELRALQEEQNRLSFRMIRLSEKMDILSGEERKEVTPMPMEPMESARKVDKEKPHPQPAGNLEFRIGGTWFSRIGIVAVIVALAYFLKYAIDNEWIGPVGRVVLGILAGIGMLFAGEKFRRKYPGYAQVLLGGGSLALYFSIYAGYSFYGLYSSVLAFLLLVLIMANTVFMAIRHDSLPIGILGIIGAYTIPFVIESAEPSLWVLYSYLTVVTAGVLAVSLYKKWSVFQYLSFFLNQIILLFVHGTGGFWPSFWFVLVLFAFYLGMATLYNIRHRYPSSLGDLGLIFLNATAFYGWSAYLLHQTIMADYMGYYAVLLALIYIYIGKMSYALCSEDRKRVYTLFLVAFILITIAIPIQLNDYLIGFAWFAEALGLSYIAHRLTIPPVMYGAMGVFLLGFADFALEVFNLFRYPWFFLNPVTFLLLLGIGVSFIMARMAEKMEWGGDLRRFIPGFLKGALLLFIFVGINVENQDFFYRNPFQFFLSPEQLSLSALWLLYALALFTYGMRRKNRYMRYSALGLMAITILKAFFIDLANLPTIFKIILFIILGLCLLGVSYYYQGKKDILKDEP